MSLIVCSSVSPFRNTSLVAEVFASILTAEVVSPFDVRPSDVAGHHLVGFGSGIYSCAYHRDLRRLVASLPDAAGASAFVFSTSGGPAWLYAPATRLFVRQLRRRGYAILGVFSCRGAYDWRPLPLPAGNRGRPDRDDLELARRRAAEWKAQADAAPVTTDS